MRTGRLPAPPPGSAPAPVRAGRAAIGWRPLLGLATLLAWTLACRSASFSPDGRQVVFLHERPGDGLQIAIHDLDSGSTRRVEVAGCKQPTWVAFSPDGAGLLVADLVEQRGDLVRIRVVLASLADLDHPTDLTTLRAGDRGLLFLLAPPAVRSRSVLVNGTAADEDALTASLSVVRVDLLGGGASPQPGGDAIAVAGPAGVLLLQPTEPLAMAGDDRKPAWRFAGWLPEAGDNPSGDGTPVGDLEPVGAHLGALRLPDGRLEGLTVGEAHVALVVEPTRKFEHQAVLWVFDRAGRLVTGGRLPGSWAPRDVPLGEGLAFGSGDRTLWIPAGVSETGEEALLCFDLRRRAFDPGRRADLPGRPPRPEATEDETPVGLVLARHLRVARSPSGSHLAVTDSDAEGPDLFLIDVIAPAPVVTPIRVP